MSDGVSKVSRAQAELLGHYVYVYYDSDTKIPFYIGRGQSGRVLSHAAGSHNELVAERIKEGNYGRDFLVYGLDPDTAKKVEAAAIDLVGIENLMNKSRGSGAVEYGRVNVATLLRALEDKPLTEVRHNLIVVSINQTYREYGDDPIALYESTRGVWTGITQTRADAADFIAGVVDDRIVYLMTAAAWLPAGSTNYFVRERGDTDDRIEFVGRTAGQEEQDLYLGRKIRANQSPTFYGPFHNKVHLVDGAWLPGMSDA
ncbi:hypothetical protein R4144_00785 [Gordonia amicalis]|uniref:hypothetical protein n=1 Tax=Gordonia amicalis TaxID=89053 RepID=UPI0029551D32|nr:hypothetical protein [Gordonia amicalis]MDV7171952.1 hypothetical protein [Gordonia amicalis]